MKHISVDVKNMEYKVIASTEGEFPFNKNHIDKLIEDATPETLVESILHKLKASSSKHKFIVTATKITTQELTGKISCQTGSLWNNKNDGYISLRLNEKTEPVENTEDKKYEENEKDEHEDSQGVEISEAPKVLDTTEEKTTQLETNKPDQLNEIDESNTEKQLEVSDETVPPESAVPILTGNSEKVEVSVPIADIDEAVGATPEVLERLSETEEPVMLAAVGPEEAERITRDRELGLQPEDELSEKHSQAVAPGSFEAVTDDVLASYDSPESPQETTVAEKNEPELTQVVKPVTTYMVTIYWIYVH